MVKKEIFEILENNARLTADEIAVMTGISQAEVESTIKKAEEERTILKYKTLINWGKLGDEPVLALVEVKVTPQKEAGFDSLAERIYRFPEARSVYLVSGTYDLAVLVSASTMHEVAAFVTEKLAPLEGIQGTVTHFLLKKYKEDGEVFEGDGGVKRQPLMP